MWANRVRFAAAVGIAATLLIAASGATRAAPPSENGRIAFTHHADLGGAPDKEWEVWSARPDGTDARLHFSAVDEFNYSATWSPDGQWLAFRREYDILVARPDGSGARLIASDAAYPSWSPDGTRLVYATGDGDGELWTVNVDGSDRRLILGGAGGLDFVGNPAWSPSAHAIAFQAYEGDMEVFVLYPHSGHVSQLTHNEDPLDDHISPVSDSFPAWSPDGGRIVFRSNRDAPLDCDHCPSDLYVMTADGQNETRLPYPGVEFSPTWSPDGTKIAFASEPVPPHSQLPWLAIRDVASGAVRKVLQTASSPDLDWGPRPGTMASADVQARIEPSSSVYRSAQRQSYRVTVSNQGPDVAGKAVVELTLAPGSQMLNADGTCWGGTVLICPVGDLLPGTAQTITVTAEPSNPGSHEVAAMATTVTPDPNPFNNRHVTTVSSCTQVGTAADDTLTGSTGTDVLCGGGGDDRLAGGAGDDILLGGAGDDTLTGGGGDDTASFATASHAVRVNLAEGAAHGQGADAVLAVEHTLGSRFADRLVGSAAANRLAGAGDGDLLVGLASGDTLVGGTGRDRLLLGPGADRALGGTGTDAVDFGASPVAVAVNLARGLVRDRATNRVVGVENVHGSARADTLRGSIVENRLVGGRGQDLIVAFGADDDAVGGRGDDRLTGGDGNDRLAAGAGTDVCRQGAGSGARRGCER